MSYTNFNMRLDNELKSSVYPVFERYGLTPSQAVRLFFTQVANTQKIPLTFDWASDIPNKETVEAIKELENGGGTTYNTAEDAMQAMLSIASNKDD